MEGSLRICRRAEAGNQRQRKCEETFAGYTKLKEERTSKYRKLPSSNVPASNSGWKWRTLTVHRLADAGVTHNIQATTFERDTITNSSFSNGYASQLLMHQTHSQRRMEIKILYHLCNTSFFGTPFLSELHTYQLSRRVSRLSPALLYFPAQTSSW